MAVEAHRLNPIFSSQFLSNWEILNPIETNGLMYATGTIETAPLKPMYNNNNILATGYLIHPTVKPEDDSCVAFEGNNERFLPESSTSLRKRSREDSSVIVNPPAMPRSSSYLQCEKTRDDPLMFLGHDMSPSVQQQHLDVDCLISHHIERMRMEIEERRKRQRRRIMEAIEQGLMRRLKAKDEEIEKIGKMNLFLEERVKSLCVENQIWRDLAQSNEATANALRRNLQQVLDAVERSRLDEANANAEEAGEAESCCGSNVVEEEEEERKKKKRVLLCRRCGEGEACVLMLPCRHLCLCTLCGSCLNTCPICKSPKNASLHVNLSP